MRATGEGLSRSDWDFNACRLCGCAAGNFRFALRLADCIARFLSVPDDPDMLSINPRGINRSCAEGVFWLCARAIFE